MSLEDFDEVPEAKSPFLEQGHRHAAEREVAGDARARHAAADHDGVERRLVQSREPALNHVVLRSKALPRIVPRGRERARRFAGRRAA
jgi:hypothetical protein